ncbi:multiple epidermal growth factor-like domains protein 6, partial [Biomphalaria glabrata]
FPVTSLQCRTSHGNLSAWIILYSCRGCKQTCLFILWGRILSVDICVFLCEKCEIKSLDLDIFEF